MSAFRHAEQVEGAELVAQLRRELDTERARAELLASKLAHADERYEAHLVMRSEMVGVLLQKLRAATEGTLVPQLERELAETRDRLITARREGEDLFLELRSLRWSEPTANRARVRDLERENDELRAIVRFRTAQRIEATEAALAQARRRSHLFGLLAIVSTGGLLAVLLRWAGAL